MELQQKIALSRNEQKVGQTFDAIITGVCDETENLGFSLYEGRIIGQAPEIDGRLLDQRRHRAAAGIAARVRASRDHRRASVRPRRRRFVGQREPPLIRPASPVRDMTRLRECRCSAILLSRREQRCARGERGARFSLDPEPVTLARMSRRMRAVAEVLRGQ